MEMIKYKLHILGLSNVRRNCFEELKSFKEICFLYSSKEYEDDVRESVREMSLL